MKKIYLLIVLVCLSAQIAGQTVVKMLMPQQSLETLSVVTLFSESLPANTAIVLGAIGYDIKGGTEPYTLTWMKDNTVITTGNIAVFTPVSGSTYKLKVSDKNNCSSEVAINVNAGSKINKENVSGNKIIVTPTLVTNQITIGFEGTDNSAASIKIFDTKGVLHQTSEVTGSTVLPVALQPGTFFVVVEKTGQYHVQKIIVH